MGGKARSPHAADGDGIMERKEGGEEGLVVSEVVAARIIPVDRWGGLAFGRRNRSGVRW
jgi:hypothetical protein